MYYFLVVPWPRPPVEIVVVGGVDRIDPRLFRCPNQVIDLSPANTQDKILVFFGQGLPLAFLPTLFWSSFDAVRRHGVFCRCVLIM